MFIKAIDKNGMVARNGDLSPGDVLVMVNCKTCWITSNSQSSHLLLRIC